MIMITPLNTPPEYSECSEYFIEHSVFFHGFFYSLLDFFVEIISVNFFVENIYFLTQLNTPSEYPEYSNRAFLLNTPGGAPVPLPPATSPHVAGYECC